MTENQQSGGFFSGLMLVVIAIAIPILIFGLTAAIKFIQIMFFSPITKGSIPVWAVFVIGFIIILWMRRR